MGSFRTSLFTGDGVSQITAVSLSHHTKSVTHSNRLTVCAQSPCPGPVSLNVSFVSGYLGFPPERGRRVFYFIFLHQSVVCWCETGQETDSVLSESLHLLEQNSLLCICSLMKISLLANLQSNHNHSQVQYVLY